MAAMPTYIKLIELIWIQWEIEDEKNKSKESKNGLGIMYVQNFIN